MNDKVEEYLNKKRKEYEDARAKKLIDLGICDRVYAPSSGFTTNEYPYAEYDQKTYTNRYYKLIPCQITDEEYEEIMKYSNTSEVKINSAFITFKIAAAIIWLFGLFGGIGTGMIFADYEFSWISAFSVWIGTFIFGLQIFGMGKIIELLSDIKYKLK